MESFVKKLMSLSLTIAAKLARVLVTPLTWVECRSIQEVGYVSGIRPVY